MVRWIVLSFCVGVLMGALAFRGGERSDAGGRASQHEREAARQGDPEQVRGLADVLEAPQTPQATHADGRIEGVIRTQDGAAVAGAEIAAVPSADLSVDQPGETEADYVRRLVERRRWRESCRRTASSGPEGE